MTVTDMLAVELWKLLSGLGLEMDLFGLRDVLSATGRTAVDSDRAVVIVRGKRAGSE